MTSNLRSDFRTAVINCVCPLKSPKKCLKFPLTKVLPQINQLKKKTQQNKSISSESLVLGPRQTSVVCKVPKGLAMGGQVDSHCHWVWASQMVLVVKNLLLGDLRDVGSFHELGRSPGGGHGNPLQYSCLGIPETEEPGGL